MDLKKIFFIGCVTALLFASCNKPRRNPGRAYMPDMAYSRAYETYAAMDSSRFTTSMEELGEGKVFYNATPVAGTRARGEMPAFHYSISDSVKAKSYVNPLPKPDSIQMKEAERLYNVNCGICHGVKLDGNGPLFTSGAYPAAPRDLMLPEMKSLSDGSMFHVVTYGKGQMGSYASQLTSQQRWMVIHYVRAKQSGTAGTDTLAVAPVSTTGVTPGGISTTTNQNSKEDAKKN